MKKRILEPGYIRLNYIVIDSESSEELENKVSNFRRENDGAILGNLAVVGNVLAAVEIASNIVRHADVPVRAAAFLCHHEVSAAELRLHFYYLGTPYDRSQVAPPDFSGAREGGFGLYIVENSVDEFSQSVIAEDVNRLSLVMQRHAAGESR